MQVIENSIDIDAPAAQVFDHVSDLRTEADWNPVATAITLEPGAPVGLGAVYAARWKGFGTAALETVVFDRPRTWTTATTRATLPNRITGTVTELGAQRSRLTMRIELLPTGVFTLLAPAIRLMMQPTAKGNLARIKTAVEALPPTARSDGEEPAAS